MASVPSARRSSSRRALPTRLTTPTGRNSSQGSDLMTRTTRIRTGLEGRRKEGGRAGPAEGETPMAQPRATSLSLGVRLFRKLMRRPVHFMLMIDNRRGNVAGGGGREAATTSPQGRRGHARVLGGAGACTLSARCGPPCPFRAPTRSLEQSVSPTPETTPPLPPTPRGGGDDAGEGEGDGAGGDSPRKGEDWEHDNGVATDDDEEAGVCIPTSAPTLTAPRRPHQLQNRIDQSAAADHRRLVLISGAVLPPGRGGGGGGPCEGAKAQRWGRGGGRGG